MLRSTELPDWPDFAPYYILNNRGPGRKNSLQ